MAADGREVRVDEIWPRTARLSAPEQRCRLKAEVQLRIEAREISEIGGFPLCFSGLRLPCL